MRSLTSPGLALAGLLLPVALVSTPAQSAPSADRVAPHAPTFKTATATFETAPSGFQVATAVCPAGQTVVSGGFTGTFEDFATYSRAAKKKTAWRVKGQFTDGAVAYAYCSKSMKVTSTTATTNVSAEVAAAYDNASATAKCPKGSVVVAGGWQIKPLAENTPVFTSAPVGKHKWTVVAVHDSGLPWTLKTYAYCFDPKLDLDYDVASQSVDAPADDNVPVVATATCTGGKVVGNGFATSPTPDFSNNTGPDTFFYTARNLGKKKITVASVNYGTAGTVTAYAVCLG